MAAIALNQVADPVFDAGVDGSSTEAEVIAAVRHGDHDAFEELVRRYQQRAYALAATLLGSRELALDAVQEAFLSIYRHRRRLDPGRPFFPWLYTTLRNRCFSMLRRRRVTQPLQALDLAQEAADAGSADDVRLALGELPAAERELLLLKYVHNYRYHEIAELLSIPPGTVGSRLHAARAQLEGALGRLGKRGQS